MPLTEAFAVVAGLLYLILAARENPWCWPFAFISTGLYLWVFADVSLQSEVLLQVFYMVMAVVGFYRWRKGNSSAKELRISTLPLKFHLLIIPGGIIAATGLGWLMKTQFEASYPYLDALVAVFSVIATFMVTGKLLENWVYWFVIDGASIFLYYQKELYFTVLLFLIYEVIVIFGYFAWLREYRNRSGG